MTSNAKKIATASVCTALAIIMCVLTAYLPLSFMPLYLAAFCIFSACKKSGVAYGALCAVASVGLMFLMCGLSVKWLLFLIMFAPYGIVTYFIDRFKYTRLKTAFIRVAIAIVYFNVTFGAVYAIAVNVMSVGLDGINITAWAELVGGYAVLAVIATAVLVPLDFIFSTVSAPILKRLPSTERKTPPPTSNQCGQGDNARAVDDVFGYEVFDKSQNAPQPEAEHDAEQNAGDSSSDDKSK